MAWDLPPVTIDELVAEFNKPGIVRPIVQEDPVQSGTDNGKNYEDMEAEELRVELLGYLGEGIESHTKYLISDKNASYLLQMVALENSTTIFMDEINDNHITVFNIDDSYGGYQGTGDFKPEKAKDEFERIARIVLASLYLNPPQK